MASVNFERGCLGFVFLLLATVHRAPVSTSPKKPRRTDSAPSKTDIPVGTHIEGFGGAQVDRFGAFDPIAAEVPRKNCEQGFQLIVAFALRRKRGSCPRALLRI